MIRMSKKNNQTNHLDIQPYRLINPDLKNDRDIRDFSRLLENNFKQKFSKVDGSNIPKNSTDPE